MKHGMDYAGIFLAGAVVGGVAAALTTPVSGRRARRILRKKVERGTSELERSTRSVRSQLANVRAMAR